MNKKTFTLVELLVVVIIFASLSQIIISLISTERDKVFFENNQKKILSYRKALVKERKAYLQDFYSLPNSLLELFSFSKERGHFLNDSHRLYFNYEYGWDGPYIYNYDIPLAQFGEPKAHHRLLLDKFNFNIDDNNAGWNFKNSSDKTLQVQSLGQGGREGGDDYQSDYPNSNYNLINENEVLLKVNRSKVGRDKNKNGYITVKEAPEKGINHNFTKISFFNKSNRLVPKVDRTKLGPTSGKWTSHHVRLVVFYPNFYDFLNITWGDVRGGVKKVKPGLNKSFVLDNLVPGQVKRTWQKNNYGTPSESIENLKKTKIIIFLCREAMGDYKNDNDKLLERILVDFEPIEVDLQKEELPSELNFYALPYILFPNVEKEVNLDDITEFVKGPPEKKILHLCFSRAFLLRAWQAKKEKNPELTIKTDSTSKKIILKNEDFKLNDNLQISYNITDKSTKSIKILTNFIDVDDDGTIDENDMIKTYRLK